MSHLIFREPLAPKLNTVSDLPSNLSAAVNVSPSAARSVTSSTTSSGWKGSRVGTKPTRSDSQRLGIRPHTVCHVHEVLGRGEAQTEPRRYPVEQMAVPERATE